LAVLTSYTDVTRMAAWNPNDTRIATANLDGKARIYYVGIEDLMRAVCRNVPRNMSQNEWARYFPDEPYRETCPQSSLGS
jgi:hypothetical protein